MMKHNTIIQDCLSSHQQVVTSLRDLEHEILSAATMISDVFVNDGRLLLCGNGGSAADAQHIAAEFSGRYLLERTPWDAIALHTNTSAVTAVGNDYGFENIFERQVRAHGRKGDIVLGISTSGQSPNIIKAFQSAREKGLQTIGLTGEGGGAMADLCHVLLAVPSKSTPRIQEMHILIGHILCQLVEEDVVLRTKTS